ncbi:MAG: hypothetical protein WCQ21_01655 [Verrucomicrobiota bacterium]|jgi:hypothetical protein
MNPQRQRTYFTTTALLGLAALLGGCAVANNAIRSDFTDFNNIIQYNQTQQMLLNLVRMHFRESPMFLQPGSLTASYESHVGASLGASIGSPGNTKSADAGVDYSFSTKPTVSYIPVEGKNYVQQFLAEISPDTFCLLLRSGWPVAELTDLLVERMTLPDGNSLVNNHNSPSDPEFRMFVTTLREAQQNGQLSVISTNGNFVLAIGTRMTPLHLFQFRSLCDVMFAASKNTQTPPGQANRVKAGKANGVMDIRASKFPLKDSMVWIKYAGYYYSISHDDIRSKDTLALLMQLYRIQAAPAGAAPILTIPAR